jgi:hypothetical protein
MEYGWAKPVVLVGSQRAVEGGEEVVLDMAGGSVVLGGV